MSGSPSALRGVQGWRGTDELKANRTRPLIIKEQQGEPFTVDWSSPGLWSQPGCKEEAEEAEELRGEEEGV